MIISCNLFYFRLIQWLFVFISFSKFMFKISVYQFNIMMNVAIHTSNAAKYSLTIYFISFYTFMRYLALWKIQMFTSIYVWYKTKQLIFYKTITFNYLGTVQKAIPDVKPWATYKAHYLWNWGTGKKFSNMRLIC